MEGASTPPIDQWAICLRLSAGLHRIIFGSKAGAAMYGMMFVELTTTDVEKLASDFRQAVERQEPVSLQNVWLMRVETPEPQRVTVTIEASNCEKMLPRLVEYLQQFAAGKAKKCSENPWEGLKYSSS